MQKISSPTELKEIVRILELEQELKGEQLKQQLHLTYESLKPVNLLKSNLSEISASPVLVNNIVTASINLITGYLCKKIVVGDSDNVNRKILANIIRVIVAKNLAQNPETVKSIGRFIMQNISSAIKTNSKKE